MSRLVVVSNRVAVPKARGVAGAQGGLAGALNSALKEAGVSDNVRERFMCIPRCFSFDDGSIFVSEHQQVRENNIRANIEPDWLKEKVTTFINNLILSSNLQSGECFKLEKSLNLFSSFS